MYRKIIAVWMSGVCLLILNLSLQTTNSFPASKDLYQNILQRFYQETGASNAVTAIYLDYRAFDTLFETLLLLVSVIGIIYFSRHEGDY